MFYSKNALSCQLTGGKSQPTSIAVYGKVSCRLELHDNFKRIYFFLLQLDLKFTKAFDHSVTQFARLCHHQQLYCIIAWHILCIMQVNHCMKI